MACGLFSATHHLKQMLIYNEESTKLQEMKVL